ncbi:MAG TPA: Nramp family divalent metal transporter [Chitinivibrionales bacterium]|nr:Nramp family divalent metal transporter [Chitinivibrionales bacterium]
MKPDLKKIRHLFSGTDSLLKYIGPGLLVTVGFIDPGNWAANLAAGSQFGYSLLWVVTLSTLMLIVLQHNAAHLGIVTGMCHAEAATAFMPAWLSRPVLASAMVAAVSTALAEILGGAIALNMLFHLPLRIGAVLCAGLAVWLLFGSSYKKLERVIVGFVSLIGLSFLAELFLVKWNPAAAASGAFVPSMPSGAMPLVMSVLGAVVMPHNLFLHSEVIQSRQWRQEGEPSMVRHLRFEIFDTFFSMVVGWAINGAMIILAAATFFKTGIAVDSLDHAEEVLRPIAGRVSSFIFAFALLFSGIASSVTAGMAGGTIFAGLFGKSYDVRTRHTTSGIAVTIIAALFVLFFVRNSFEALLISQMLLSIQLPITVCLQIYLTSSKKVMGKYANRPFELIALLLIAGIAIVLNVMLLVSYIK